MAPYRIYYLFRLKQLARLLKSAGWPGLLAAPVAFLFLLSMWEALAELSLAELVVVSALPALYWHFSRRDRLFLQKHQFPIRRLIAAEYAVSNSLVIIVPVIISKAWAAIPASVAVAAFIALFEPPRWRKLQRPLQWTTLAPLLIFEWRLALRQHGLIWLLVLLLSFLSPLWEGAILLSAGMGALLLPSVFEYQEPRSVTFSVWGTPRGLWRHLGWHIATLWLLFLPGSLLHVYFYPNLWFFPLVAASALGLMAGYAIAHKYANFRPKQSRNQAGITAALVFGAIAIPVFIPFAIGYIIYLWKQALARLHFQYHCGYVSHR